jgi:hypothetical protein
MEALFSCHIDCSGFSLLLSGRCCDFSGFIGPPLQKAYDSLARLLKLPADACRLAWAFFVSKTHPVCLG